MPAPTPPRTLAQELHQAVMNVNLPPVKVDPACLITYSLGARDARHAVAEMLLADPRLNVPAEAQGARSAQLPPGDAVLLEMLANELDEESERGLREDGGRNWFTYTQAIRRVLASPAPPQSPPVAEGQSPPQADGEGPMIECRACSIAGGADRAVFHGPPECKMPDAATAAQAKPAREREPEDL